MQDQVSHGDRVYLLGMTKIRLRTAHGEPQTLRLSKPETPHRSDVKPLQLADVTEEFVSYSVE
jgi:hypothetical protein